HIWGNQTLRLSEYSQGILNKYNIKYRLSNIFLYLENIIHSHQSQINLILHKKSGGSKKTPDALSLLYLMLYF
ncbi:hypothetical protein, partial [Escherichia coli]|uniref:hypothetical protein n=1 Tax=Escherichia coli TaxID=562 RepID=UPI001BFC446A